MVDHELRDAIVILAGPPVLIVEEKLDRLSDDGRPLSQNVAGGASGLNGVTVLRNRQRKWENLRTHSLQQLLGTVPCRPHTHRAFKFKLPK